MNGAQSLMLAAAKLLPLEILIEELETALAEYKVDQSTQNKNKVAMYSMLVMTSITTESKDLVELTNELNTIEKRNQVFKDKVN